MDNTFNIEIMMTYNCNFRCTYCYEYDKGTLKSDVKEKIISDATVNSFIAYIDNFLENYKTSDVSIGFWGGEPTLAAKSILKIVNAFKKNDRVYFKLITNGFNLSAIERIAKGIPSRRFNVQVSYDYYLQKSRRIHKKSLSTDIVLKHIVSLLKLGYNISTKSTILLEDLDKIELVYNNFINVRNTLLQHKLNIGMLNITVDTEGKLPYDINIDQILEDFESQLVKIKSSYTGNVFNFMHDNRNTCTMGINFFAVDINGDIYPCHGMLFNSSKNLTYMGNLNEDVSNNVFKRYTLTELFPSISSSTYTDECAKCETNFCYTCPAHCFSKSKKVNTADKLFDLSSDKIRCDVFKIITKYI